jgi:hypothetical protein
MRKPTPTQIKESGVLGEYFFSRDTLRFFGQTMRSFRTQWLDRDNGVVCLMAPSYDHEGTYMGMTRRFIQVIGDQYEEVRP